MIVPSFLQVLNQEETPFLYSVVFGEGVVNDATSVVLFNAIQKFDLTNVTPRFFMEFLGNFCFLFSTSTLLGVAVSLYNLFLYAFSVPELSSCNPWNHLVIFFHEYDIVKEQIRRRDDALIWQTYPEA